MRTYARFLNGAAIDENRAYRVVYAEWSPTPRMRLPVDIGAALLDPRVTVLYLSVLVNAFVDNHYIVAVLFRRTPTTYGRVVVTIDGGLAVYEGLQDLLALVDGSGPWEIHRIAYDDPDRIPLTCGIQVLHCLLGLTAAERETPGQVWDHSGGVPVLSAIAKERLRMDQARHRFLETEVVGLLERYRERMQARRQAKLSNQHGRPRPPA